MRLIGYILVVLTALGLKAQSSFAVKSESGEVLIGATAILRSFKGELQEQVISNENGIFMSSLPFPFTAELRYVGYNQLTEKITKQNQIITLTPLNTSLEEVVVTATRTSRLVDDVPLPISIVGNERITKISSLRLNEVLQEQTGLQITSDHGTGLMMQGLTSDYILFLIDGEPVIGRTAGTLSLNRLAVDNIERVEIIKGPSSSLYGSEAMAGVVNIITKKTESGFTSNVRTRYRTFGTSNISTTLGYSKDKLKVSFFADRLGTQGYDLNEGTVSMTAPPYAAYTLNPKVAYAFSNAIKLSINGRFYTESQENVTDLTLGEGDDIFRMDEEGLREDWNFMPSLNIKVNDRHQLQLRSYTTGYRTESTLTYQLDGAIYDESYFDQLFNRSEVQHDWYINEQHVTTLGIGHTRESVEATSYDDVDEFSASYGFVQHQWMPSDKLNFIAGGRYDAHSEYASRFSPKLAVGYTVSKQIKVQASFGGGYKAPDFRQLLLNFTNPTVGYTVIGSSIVKEHMAELQLQGQIASILIDPNTIETIEAESSIAYNAGIKFTRKKFSSELNLFRNEISNLIDTAPVARKTNGQNVFSYFNFDDVVTQGVEINNHYQLTDEIGISLGYQYLDSRNLEDIDKIKEGGAFARDPQTNLTSRVEVSDYGGLIGRSRHSGNAKVFYTNVSHQFDVSLRGIYRGRWGVGDSNGNGFIDSDMEYADGYFLLNLALNKNLYGWMTLETGVNNMLDTTNEFEPSIPGRIYYVGFNLKLSDIGSKNQ